VTRFNTADRAPQESVQRDRGASLVEYALVVALIAVVCIAAVSSLGGTTSSVLNDGSTGIDNAPVTTTTLSGCASVHADGYGTGPGYGWDCYSPTFGPYNIV